MLFFSPFCVGQHIHTHRPLPIIFSLLSVCLILHIKTGVQSTQFDWTRISSEWESDEGPFGWWSPDTPCSWSSLLLWCIVKLSQESELLLVGIQNDRSLRWRAPVFYGWTMTARLKTDMWHWQKGKGDVVYVWALYFSLEYFSIRHFRIPPLIGCHRMGQKPRHESHSSSRTSIKHGPHFMLSQSRNVNSDQNLLLWLHQYLWVKRATDESLQWRLISQNICEGFFFFHFHVW